MAARPNSSGELRLREGGRSSSHLGHFPYGMLLALPQPREMPVHSVSGSYNHARRPWRRPVGDCLFHVFAGIVVISNPLLASQVFTLFLAFAILVAGAARIVVAFQHRDHAGWTWPAEQPA
jgi:hypothetical protein